MEPSVSQLILTALAENSQGMPARDLRCLLPADYMPSAAGNGISIKLAALARTGYIRRSETRSVPRIGHTSTDRGGGYLYWITPLGEKWLARGCPPVRWWEHTGIMRQRDIDLRQKMLRQAVVLLAARAAGYGHHTPVAARSVISAQLHEAGLTHAQIGKIFGVCRERVRQYEVLYHHQLP